MGKDFHHVGRNVDLDKLTEKIEGFLTIDGFDEVKIDKNTTEHWIEIQARKSGFGRTLVSSRKVIHIGIIIRRTPKINMKCVRYCEIVLLINYNGSFLQ